MYNEMYQLTVFEFMVQLYVLFFLLENMIYPSFLIA